MGYSLLDIANTQLPPPEILPVSEQKMRIKNVFDRNPDSDKGPFSSGREGWVLVLESNDHPNVDGIFHNLLQPVDDDKASVQRMYIEDIQAFVKAFGITSNDSKDWIGKEGWCNIGVETYEGKERNVVKGFIAPK